MKLHYEENEPKSPLGPIFKKRKFVAIVFIIRGKVIYGNGQMV
jgi:hypothetical protein